MAKREGRVDLELEAVEEELDLCYWSELAISLLEKALSYSGEDEEWLRMGIGICADFRSNDMLRHARERRDQLRQSLSDLRLRLINYPASRYCGYHNEICEFRIAVELFEDLIEEIEHRSPKEEGPSDLGEEARIRTTGEYFSRLEEEVGCRMDEEDRHPTLFGYIKTTMSMFSTTGEYVSRLEGEDRRVAEEQLREMERLMAEVHRGEIQRCSLDTFLFLLQRYKDRSLEALIDETIEQRRQEEAGRRSGTLPLSSNRCLEKLWFDFLLQKGVSRLGMHLPAADRRLGDVRVHPRRSSTVTEDMVGREREKEQIVQCLIKQPAENSNHIRLLAITGVAGMGKTTLAKLACKDPTVLTSFDLVVWVQVPYDFTTEPIEKAMLPLLTTVSDKYYTSKLLQHAVTGKRILLALDDAWADESADKWRALATTLKNCKGGSWILLTTRMQSVVDVVAAALGSPAECLELDELGENENLLLFMSRLPPQVYSEDYARLRLIGEQIARHTGGCPLVTEQVASWLGSHMETHHWNAVLQKGWQKMEQLMNIFQSLRLSYDRLPSRLQICFRYCSIFPKGYKFNKVELANMWISSGLIPFSSSEQDDTGLQHKKGVYLFSAEDVGEQYFTALVRKSFFSRMLEIDPSDGNLKEYYVMHSLMHDCAQFVAQNECARVDNNHFQHVGLTTTHLSIAWCGNLSVLSNLRHLRTLIIWSQFCLDEEAELMLGRFLHSSKRLRMLYLDVPSLSHALDRISNLTQLRYVFLYSCDKSHIQGVFKLYRLQVFKLNYFTGEEANLDGIQNLHSLRCLHVPDSMLSKILQIGISPTLQELHGFEVVENDGHMLSALSTLRNLQRLSLRNLQNIRNSEEAMMVKLKHKRCMRFLSLSWNKHSNDPENLDHEIVDCLEPNKRIQQLHIYGYNGVQLPIWIENSSLIHLVSLELEYCIKWKTLPSFKELSSLKYLKLERLFQLGVVIEEQSGSIESDNAFLPPLLNTLIVQWCPSLKKLPALPSTLEKLIIRHAGLTVLPTIHQVYTSTYESSSVDSCLSLVHIESCAHLISLDGLLEQQQHLQHLKTLLLRHCAKLRHLPANGFTELHQLNFLEIVACPMLRNVETEGNLFPTSLDNLDINPCGHIEASVLMSLPNLTYLRRLSLFSCSSVENLPSDEVFRSLKNLNAMSIARCKSLLSLGGLGVAASLRTLSIMCCDKIQSSSSPQAGCSFNLWKLKIDRQALLLVEPLKSLRYIIDLHIGDDYAMESLPEEWLLQNASSLRLIEIGVAENLQTLPAQMEKLESLQSLHIERAPRIQFLPQLPVALSKLTIWDCNPSFLKRYETNVSSDWVKIKDIAHVDVKAYSEETSDDDDRIQHFDDSASYPSNQFIVID